ncbi:MAG: M1 family aminopeptidase [Flavisolibacter sp.]
MKRIAFLVFCTIGSTLLLAQPSQRTTVSTEYRATAEKINDLVHTKLDAHFDYDKSQLNGKVWITLHPHFYPTDSLSLDAKGMDIHEVAMVKNGKNSTLKYDYDGSILRIQLDKTYKNNEQYTVYINYTAKPEEYNGKGSAAITEAKGLYFINPRGEEKDKPTQIWTQGETEANSVWIPIIDKPDQKLTDEIYMTVPSKYVTLSNGKLVSQKTNSDGTRTDYWRMDFPHAPYLFFMGVGDYAVIKDKYKDKEVNYYVEKQYAPVARRIFGNTPQMIALFSKLTGIDYPWVKYSQIVGRDYVSGAMENTTATLHQESAQQDARELTDGNRWEDVISHELFHQWFGDLVTTESWSNITLNESFATIGSQLWNEYHYGKDAGDAERFESIRQYIGSHSETKNLVRFYYNDKEDVFDAVSYNKGGAILQMLRNFVGDSAFFKSLNLYLNTNKFKSAEAQQLRLAFEDVTGKDLNWFWNQWYYGSGHPKLDIKYSYDNAAQKVRVIVTQNTDKNFIVPVKIDVWNGDSPTRYEVWVKNKIDSFSFASSRKPDLVNFDGDKKLLAEKTENKSLDEYLFQYRHARNYVDRREAIDAALKDQSKEGALAVIMAAMNDVYAPLQAYSVGHLDLNNNQMKSAVEPTLYALAQKDANKKVKAAAIGKLGNYRSAKYVPLFKAAVNDSSYTVSGNALEALAKTDTTAAYTEAQRLSGQPSKGKLASSIKTILSSRNGAAAIKMLEDFEALPMGQSKFQALDGLFEFLYTTNNLELFKRGVDDLFTLESQTPEAFRDQLVTALNTELRKMQKEKAANGQTDQSNYLDSKLPKDKDF